MSEVDKKMMRRKEVDYIYDCETTGLEPFEHRILCISVMNLKTNEVKTFVGEDEQQLLKDFWQYVINVNHLIGFNSDSFDYPFIIQRCLFYGIKCLKPLSIDLRKESTAFWSSYNKYAKGKLSQWAEKFGLPVDTEDGSKMPGLYAQGKWDEIKSHCEEDIKITYQLYLRCKNCGVL